MKMILDSTAEAAEEVAEQVKETVSETVEEVKILSAKLWRKQQMPWKNLFSEEETGSEE